MAFETFTVGLHDYVVDSHNFVQVPVKNLNLSLYEVVLFIQIVSEIFSTLN